MGTTPDRKPGPLQEDEEIQLGTNASEPSVAGAFNYNGSSFKFKDGVGVFDPRTGGNYLAQKAGKALAASFSGAPAKATVTFSGAFSDANYSVALTLETTGNKTFAPSVESVAADSFVIHLGSGNTSGLTAVHWTAMKHGESS